MKSFNGKTTVNVEFHDYTIHEATECFRRWAANAAAPS
jgi:hypothetical protein